MMYINPHFVLLVFELLERGEVLTVPTDTPLDEKSAWLAFRDVILGLEYREYITIIYNRLNSKDANSDILIQRK